MAPNETSDVPWFLKSSYPVLFPTHEALTKPRAEFEAYIRNELACRHDVVDSARIPEPTGAVTGTSASFTEINLSTMADIREDLWAMDVDDTKPYPSDCFTEIAPSTTADIGDCVQAMDVDTTKVDGPTGHPFMDGLLSHDDKPEEVPNMERKMLTKNLDVAYQSTMDPLVDLFSELEDVITPPRLRELLEAAWNRDPISTLKIIFNARSIHLGKSSKHVFYLCAGWLAQNHPLTLVANLQWLSRPVIPKKERKDKADDDVVLIEEEKDENDPTRYDVRHGMAHGYWKDLVNMLVLAANGKLNCLSDPREVLNIENPDIIKGKSVRARNKKLKRRGRGRGRDQTPAAAGVIMWKDKPVSSPLKFDDLSELPDNESDLGSEEAMDRQLDKALEQAINRKSNQELDHEDTDKEATQPAQTDETVKVQCQSSRKGLPEWQEKKREVRDERHRAAVKAFNEDHVYRALHLTVARLFAEQLEADLRALRGEDPKAKRTMSLCSKWAPSHNHFHDRHSFVVSTIAEIMYPRESFDHALSATDDRETYLRHAREQYRKDTSALRKHLEIVERDITAETFGNIKYDRVPSVAMNNYSELFAEKDFDHFERYIDRVAEGKSKISGATLLPSTLVQYAMSNINTHDVTENEKRRMNTKDLVEHKMRMLQSRVVDGQWKTLVQRIKDSGTLSSAIAVCDVSGSMDFPRFEDGTCPMDSAIGLSLLIASATELPFGGAFITFSARPEVQKINLTLPLTQQAKRLRNANWSMNTNFVDVFEQLLLPMAKKNQLKPQDMVKRVFVFSDMQFDSAERIPHGYYGDENYSTDTWGSSYERIKLRFETAGYEMPELVFWNLDAGRNGMAPKPVTVADEGTTLVGGYSQGMLKVFLDSGGFEEPDAEDDTMVVSKDEDGDVTAEPTTKKAKMDPLRTVKKAVGHKSYDMLKVLD